MATALACVAALLAACGGGGDGGTPGGAPGRDSQDASGPRWVVLGSSTALGVGASPGHSWAERLHAELEARGVQLDNRARSGAVTYEALPAATLRPAERPPSDPQQDIAAKLTTAAQVVILAFPSNDAVRGYSAHESAANLLLMREVAQQHGTGVIVLSSQPRDGASPAAYAAMLAADAVLQAEVGACFVAVHAALADAQGKIAPRYASSDGIHLNNAGHGVIFEQLWATITAGRCVTLR